MAKINAAERTAIRELSVLYGLSIANSVVADSELSQNIVSLTPTIFYQKLTSSCLILSEDILFLNNLETFDEGTLRIIEAGIHLAKQFNDMGLVFSENCSWVGAQRNKTPEDIYIGDFGVSLKEDSDILSNMSLKNLLEVLGSDENHVEEKNVFMRFAQKEYEECLRYVFSKLLFSLQKNFPQVLFVGPAENKGVISLKDTRGKKEIVFSYKGSVVGKIPEVSLSTLSNKVFLEHTNTVSRGKVFAKWINENLSKDSEYLRLKKIYSQTAGENLKRFIDELQCSPDKLLHLLRIHEKSYYYAKVSNNRIEIFEVPSSETFVGRLKIHNVEVSVPKSQLNLKITIIDTLTEEKITLRTEHRFSHGQFNGVPESKLYYEDQSSLENFYILKQKTTYPKTVLQK